MPQSSAADWQVEAFVCTNKKKVSLLFIAGFLSLYCMVSKAQEGKRAFTVADEIGLALFIPGLGDSGRNVRFSPDGNHFAV